MISRLAFMLRAQFQKIVNSFIEKNKLNKRELAFNLNEVALSHREKLYLAQKCVQVLSWDWKSWNRQVVALGLKPTQIKFQHRGTAVSVPAPGEAW